MEARQEGPTVFDINNPPKVPYTHQAYPKLVYGSKGEIKTADSPEMHKMLTEEGYQAKPLADYDYSEVSQGVAKKKAKT